MAASGYTPIQLYHSTTASAVPVNTDLVNGELAINIADGKLYYKDSGGTVQVIATKGTGTIGGSNTQVQYNSSGVLAGSANFTFNGTTATINTLNLTNALGATYGGTAQSTYTQGDLLYASAANTLSKLAIGSNTYILTSNGTVPGWAAPSSISVNTATNLAGGAGGSVPYQSGAGATTFLSIGTANQVMTSSGSLPQWSSGLSITTLTASDAVTFSATTQNIALGTSQTTGTFTVGGAAQTGTQTFDQSTKTHTLNLGTGATESGLTKTINLGTAGVSGSTTAINIGSANGTSTTLNGTVTAATLNSTTIDTTNIEVTNIKAKDGTAALSIADSTGVVSVSANPVLSGGTANGILYLNGSKSATSGSALVFDGTNLGLGVTPSGPWDSPALMFGKPGSSNPTYPFITSINSQEIAIGSNSYWDGSNWKAQFSPAVVAAQMRIKYNEISWHVAPAVSAGTNQSFSQAMTLDADGDLGVGTTNPTTVSNYRAITVNGTNGGILDLKYGDTLGGRVVASSGGLSLETGGATLMAFYTNNLERARITSGGLVLINRNSPAGGEVPGLHISGSSDTTNTNYTFYTVYNNNTEVFGCRNDGFVRATAVYNKTDASAANVYVDSDGLLYRSTSSRRYKTDVQNATHGLAEVMQLRPVTYKGINNGDTVFGGLIAEEVHAAGLTEFVAYNDANEPDALHYGHMVALLTKAIQEQQAIISGLTARIAALEAA